MRLNSSFGQFSRILLLLLLFFAVKVFINIKITENRLLLNTKNLLTMKIKAHAPFVLAKP